jgi:hypothetical protein
MSTIHKLRFRKLTSFKPEIPILRGDSNFANWDNILHRSLKLVNLTKYIERDVGPPLINDPENPTPEEYAALDIYDLEMDQVGLWLANSLTDPTIDQTLINNGWDRNEANPYKTYELVKKVINRVLVDMTGQFIKEFTTLKRKNFATLRDYQTRLQLLKGKIESLRELEIPPHLPFFVWIALNGLKDAYPTEHRFWVRDIGYIRGFN